MMHVVVLHGVEACAMVLQTLPPSHKHICQHWDERAHLIASMAACKKCSLSKGRVTHSAHWNPTVCQ